MRLIDADALIFEIWETTIQPEWCKVLTGKVIMDQPTVDAVPVIRCKDCKFHHDRTQCKKRIGAWFDDDYCNGAVRAEGKEK